MLMLREWGMARVCQEFYGILMVCPSLHSCGIVSASAHQSIGWSDNSGTLPKSREVKKIVHPLSFPLNPAWKKWDCSTLKHGLRSAWCAHVLHLNTSVTLPNPMGLSDDVARQWHCFYICLYCGVIRLYPFALEGQNVNITSTSAEEHRKR